MRALFASRFARLRAHGLSGFTVAQAVLAVGIYAWAIPSLARSSSSPGEAAALICIALVGGYMAAAFVTLVGYLAALGMGATVTWLHRDPLRHVVYISAVVTALAAFGWLELSAGMGRDSTCTLDPPAGVICDNP